MFLQANNSEIAARSLIYKSLVKHQVPSSFLSNFNLNDVLEIELVDDSKICMQLKEDELFIWMDIGVEYEELMDRLSDSDQSSKLDDFKNEDFFSLVQFDDISVLVGSVEVEGCQVDTMFDILSDINHNYCLIKELIK